MATIIPSKARPAAPWSARRAGDDYGAHDEPDWRSIDWREHLRDVELGGRRVRYVDLGSGDGPPIVLVHGLSGNWQNWLENIPRLARARRGREAHGHPPASASAPRLLHDHAPPQPDLVRDAVGDVERRGALGVPPRARGDSRLRLPRSVARHPLPHARRMGR